MLRRRVRVIRNIRLRAASRETVGDARRTACPNAQPAKRAYAACSNRSRARWARAAPRSGAAHRV